MAFDPGTGTDSSYSNKVTLLPNKQILLTGGFTKYNGVTKNQIALLHENGSLDTAFDAGTVSNYYYVFQWKPRVLSNGKIIISGPFTTYNGVARPGIARLNLDGSVDTTFYPSSGIQGATASVTYVQPDDKMLVDWHTYTGGSYSTSYHYIGRINSDPATVQNGYKVECIYGDATMSNPITDTCTKNIIVRESTPDNAVQGCASIGNNYENTIGYEQWISTTPFNAAINCYARK